MVCKYGPVDTCKAGFLLFLMVNVYVQAILQCANTIDEWNKASVSLQCKEPNYYHCLKNENGNLTQQCLQKVWIQKGMCPEFNSRVGRIDVFQCQPDENNCPNTIFWSNAVYLYPVCYGKIIPKPHTKTSTTMSPTATPSGNMNQNNGNLTTTLAIALPIVGVVLIVIVVLIVFKLRRGKNRESNTEDKSQTEGLEEKVKMLDSSDGEKHLREESNIDSHNKEDQTYVRYEKRNNSKSTNVVKILDDLISEVGKTRHGSYILVLLYRSPLLNDDIKSAAKNNLGIEVDLQNDYKKWITSKTKTEASYVFKDWITSNDFDINEMRATLVDILRTINENETKFVLVFPFNVWGENAHLKQIVEWNISRQKTII